MSAEVITYRKHMNLKLAAATGTTRGRAGRSE